MISEDKPYESLLAWKRADQFVIDVYSLTLNFPKHELYGLTSQLRRAAVSVPLNIIEGRARKGTKEYLRFLYMARGSLSECAYILDLSYRLTYLSQSDFLKLEELRNEVSYLLQRLIDSLSPTPSTPLS